MPRYTRAWIPGGSFFFTVALLERRRRLLTDHIELLRDSIRQVRTRHPFAIDAMVVLPDHFHAIWTLPPGDADFSTRMRLIKAGFSRAIPATERLSDIRLARGERGIWQRRFWEHAIRDEGDWQRHIDYIHYNPVKHGQIRRVQDWPHSSFHRYVQAGIYPADWAGTAETSVDQRE
jgi:putative transposase